MNFDLIHVFKHAIMITGFVFVMMLVIEYVNVQSKGLWLNIISKNKWKQYIFAALLGAIPGCLGAFTAVAMFSHGLISFGAIVAAMIATSGDEAFVMFAMFPQKAALLTLILIVLGIFAGFLADKVYTPKKAQLKFSKYNFHLHDEEQCNCFQKNVLLSQLIRPTVYRLLLFVIVISLFIGSLSGWIAGDAKMWIKVSLIVVISFSLFIILTVPNHFLKKHLWQHIVIKHLPQIFFWTLGTLLVFSVLMQYVDVESWITNNMLLVLVVAVIVGIIPESGPHLIFVTLFAQGSIPFSVLLASSIVQDGHGMLPLLAESRYGFLAVKITNIIYGLIIGIGGYLFGI